TAELHGNAVRRSVRMCRVMARRARELSGSRQRLIAEDLLADLCGEAQRLRVEGQGRGGRETEHRSRAQIDCESAESSHGAQPTSGDVRASDAFTKSG